MKVAIIGYEKTKYEAEEHAFRVEYENVKNWKVVQGEEATAIGQTTDEASRDEYNEYLVLTFEDGEEATFRNSHVDLFIW